MIFCHAYRFNCQLLQAENWFAARLSNGKEALELYRIKKRDNKQNKAKQSFGRSCNWFLYTEKSQEFLSDHYKKYVENCCDDELVIVGIPYQRK